MFSRLATKLTRDWFSEAPGGAGNLTYAIAAATSKIPRIYRLVITTSTAITLTIKNTSGGQTLAVLTKVTQVNLGNVLSLQDMELIKGLISDGVTFAVDAACSISGFVEWNQIQDTDVGSGGNPNRIGN